MLPSRTMSVTSADNGYLINSVTADRSSLSTARPITVCCAVVRRPRRVGLGVRDAAGGPWAIIAAHKLYRCMLIHWTHCTVLLRRTFGLPRQAKNLLPLLHTHYRLTARRELSYHRRLRRDPPETRAVTTTSDIVAANKPLVKPHEDCCSATESHENASEKKHAGTKRIYLTC